MIVILLLLLLLVPLAELWAIVEVADGIGILPTLLLLVLVSVAGTWCLKQQGTATWRRMNETLRRGEMPTKEVTDGALILFGGALLLTPGFLTDAVGLTLLFPPTRAAVKRGVRALLARRVARRRAPVSGGYVRSARVVHVERATDAPEASSDGVPAASDDDPPDRKGLHG